MNKNITAVIAESGAYHDLQIAPGTTTRDIRNQLHLGEHYLISKRGAEPFGEDENIYGAINPGEKLFISTPVEVGNDFLEKIEAYRKLFPQPKRVLPASVVRTQVPIGRKPILVQRDSRPFWQQRGWVAHGREFHGYYRTSFGSWKGKATVSPSGRIELFIHGPPEALQNHSHWACFQSRSGDWYFIHTQDDIQDLSSGLIAVEKILVEAHSSWTQTTSLNWPGVRRIWKSAASEFIPE